MNPWWILWIAVGVAFGSLFECWLDNRYERRRWDRGER